MKTAFDICKRLIELDSYIEAVRQGRLSISTWNEELGEGNPDANALASLQEELLREQEYLEIRLKEINV